MSATKFHTQTKALNYYANQICQYVNQGPNDGKRKYTESFRRATIKGISWWKVGMCGLRGLRINTKRGTFLICDKEEGWSHRLKCEQ
jgi:hypothetical protein